MADVAFEDLPLYLGEPKVQPSRSSPASSSAWTPAAVLTSVGGAGRGSTMVMTRIVPLVPSVAVDALLSWWQSRNGLPVVYGRSHFSLTVPALRPESCDQCQMRVRLHRPCRWRDTPLEVELSPWSHSLTEIDLRPLRWKVAPSESYYAAGHALLDMLERAMVRQVARRPVLTPRTWRGIG
jgi:hypothetical protein